MDALSDKLSNIFTTGLREGYSYTQMANLLSDMTGVGLSSSVRLIKTELTGITSKTLLSYYTDTGITQVQQISTLDNRTSEICIERDQAIINIADAVIGENIPPLHPYCRSIIVPILT